MSDNTLFRLQAAADIIGGDVFYATDEGKDPEYEQSSDLYPNGMYIRLNGSDGSVAYVSAYEIDKAIGIIGEMSMSKAAAADLDSLRAEVEQKASALDIELIESELEGKASKSEFDAYTDSITSKADKTVVDSLILAVNGKADKSVVEALSSAISSKADDELVQTLIESISTKADNSTLEALRRDVAAIQNALGSVDNETSVNALKAQIEYLNSEIKKKLTVNDLVPLQTGISNLGTADDAIRERIETLETNIVKKASTVYVQGQVNELNHAITSLAVKVDTKADKSVVDTKAAKADLDKLVKNVTSLNTNVNASIDAIEAKNDEIIASLETKASAEALEAARNEFNTAIANKANKGDIDDSINKLTAKLNTVESEQAEINDHLYKVIDDLDCNVDNELNEIRNSITIQSKQIDTATSQINKLQESEIKFTEQLRNEWVRVMTPEEYKRLAPVGDTYSDGSLNPYAKQANTIYMLVRYNKPIAVYIGEVLIAQAEQRGSVGFAYTFPISF